MSRAGKMKDRITFRRANRTEDGSGGFEQDDVTLAVVWGEFTPAKTGRETVIGDKTTAIAFGKVKVRSSVTIRSILESDKIIIKQVEYQIRWMDDLERRNQYMWFEIERGVVT